MWLPEIVARHRDRRPDALALRDVRRDVTWRDLDRDVRALAGVIAGTVPPGGRVVVHSGNRVEVLETYIACAMAGVVAAPVNPALTDSETGYILDRLEPRLFVAAAAGADRLREACPGVPVQAIEEIADLPDAPAPERPGSLTRPAAVLHTSATTGRPKGVVVDQRSFQVNALSWLADVGAGEQTVFLNACPLFHGSMVIALDYLAAGATVCVLDRFTPQGCLEALRTWGCDHAFLVPSMVRLVLESLALAEGPAGALDLLLHGAAPMPPELAEAAAARLGVRLQTIYGITEGGGPALTLRPDDKPSPEPPVPGAICLGRPMLGTAARVAAGDGRTAATGEIGEIRLRGDGLMRGYWRDSAATAKSLADGELRTGDLGCADPDGFVWVVDRRTDLILRGGQNVYPAEIEHVLRLSPRVADVAVVPAPSPVWGQTPVAFVRPAGTEPFDERELLELCVTHLASYKRPARFIEVDEIPRNPAGKILRTALRERAVNL